MGMLYEYDELEQAIITGAQTGHRQLRPEYLGECREGPPYANDRRSVRRGQSGDKLRRKAFEGNL